MNARPAVALTLPLCLLLGAATVRAAGPATITFRKVFKSSSPEYAEIRVDEQGHGSYDIRQLDDPPNPENFQVGPAVTQTIFVLASKLNNFQGAPLNLRRRIAYLGEKTFRYERDGLRYETSFNYTENSTANRLLDLFEGLVRQQAYLQTLQRTMRYDHLGINEVLARLQTDLAKKAIPEPAHLLPLLDQIAANTEYLNIARERARAIATRIRASE